MLQRPLLTAVVLEAECIGCTLCIQACPFDAILGSKEQMHTVITSECTGCKLCVAPCPVDCIEMVVIEPRPDKETRLQRAAVAKHRYHAREKRSQDTKKSPEVVTTIDKETYLQDIFARAKAKKSK